MELVVMTIVDMVVKPLVGVEGVAKMLMKRLVLIWVLALRRRDRLPGLRRHSAAADRYRLRATGPPTVVGGYWRSPVNSCGDVGTYGSR